MAKYLVAGNATVQVDDSGGILRDITAHLTEIETFGKEYQEVDDTALGDTAESVVVGIEAGQEFALRGFLDDTALTGSDTVLNNAPGTVRTVKITVKSTVRSVQAECLCLSYKPSISVKDYARFEARFKTDGAVTVGT